MGHRGIRCMAAAAAAAWAGLGLAFNAPSDRQQGVTLSVEGVPEKVATDQPLSFTVTLKNERAEAVAGRVAVWLNDDWEVAGPTNLALSAAPGQSASAACTARARAGVLTALYPVHAALALEAGGCRIDLHPIAIFEAARPVSAKAPGVMKESVLSDGALRLDTGATRQVFLRQKEKVTDLGVNFSGADPASGTHMSRESTTRGGVARAGFAIHPAYRNGPGVTWNEFQLALPAGKPAVLRFYTSLRDTGPKEPPSDGAEFKVLAVGGDGAEKELFTRFSDCKTWEPAAVDLGAYAGQHLTLRLWTGPGPKNNTTCDQCYWGDPTVTVGHLPVLQSEAQWQALEERAVACAKLALTKKPKRGTGIFRLDVNGQRFGAAVALGTQGLTDGVLAFSDGARALAYRGFACEVGKASVGGVENGQPVLSVSTSEERGAWCVTHQVAGLGPDKGAPLPMRAKIWAEGGALRIAWDMPGVTRNTRGEPRYTRLGLGTGSEPVWRAYAGFGNVIENPGAFELHGGGFILSTRHIGADHTNGLSLVQACDIFPDRLTHAPAARRFALETQHDAGFFFVPSAKGAFDAARAYRDLAGFKKGPGVDALLGRMCLDQWGGDYDDAARDLAEAARYGVTDAIFVKHVWQRWGYDYRLPEIYPPAGGLEPFLALRQAAEKAGMLFCPHDNYIDFYPDAEGYSYDRIVFTEDGRPVKAWFNKGRDALSYRWLPHGFRPWLEPNMRRMKEGFGPDSLFIDVFTAISPFDYYDRAGTFYPRMRTAQEWRDAFDTCRSILKKGAPMLSEAGADSLIGSLDGGQADHFPAARWMKEFGDADRTPWHDMATHGKMVLLAGGLGPRYSADDWDDHGGKPNHGYGSDDYLSNTVMGGRNPMCDGPFSRRAVMTYWLLHDVCEALARQPFESHDFGANIHQQHTAFGKGGQVWVNRSSNAVWQVAGKALPQYGFYAKTEDAEAGVVLLDSQRAGFASSPSAFFADARPVHHPQSKLRVESAASGGRYLGEGAFEVTFAWNVLTPPLDGFAPFIHVCSDKAGAGSGERIAFQADMAFDRTLLKRAGAFTGTARIQVPASLPAGEYRVRYGLYRPGKGDRVAIRGLSDGGQRILGGVLTVEKSGDRFTAGRYALEQDDAAQAAGLNTAKRMLDFGPLATDGAFRLIHADRGAWQLIPLPGSASFRAELRLAALGATRAKVASVEAADPAGAAAKPPEWRQDGATVSLACDGQAFAYLIRFE